MSKDAKKAASSKGETRKQGTTINRYLEAIAANKPKRGRKRTPESIQKKLDSIDAEMSSVNALKKLRLVQERMDLEEALRTLNDKPDLSEIEAEFAAVAGKYSASQGISFAAWREMGVDAEVLKRAGIKK